MIKLPNVCGKCMVVLKTPSQVAGKGRVALCVNCKKQKDAIKSRKCFCCKVKGRISEKYPKGLCKRCYFADSLGVKSG